MAMRNGNAALLPWEPDDKGNNKWSLRILDVAVVPDVTAVE
jgi:hypothetical protein